MFKRQGVDIADATIGGWVNATGRLLKALYEAHKKKVLLLSLIHIFHDISNRNLSIRSEKQIGIVKEH